MGWGGVGRASIWPRYRAAASAAAAAAAAACNGRERAGSVIASRVAIRQASCPLCLGLCLGLSLSPDLPFVPARSLAGSRAFTFAYPPSSRVSLYLSLLSVRGSFHP
jgi:hypothetical protein